MTAAKKLKAPATVWSALRKRFPAPEWAYFDQVRNGTGFSRRVTRTADALALGLWPSRGIELNGIEVKVARNDWLREKNDPAKAEEIAKYCHRWWLVTDEGIAKLEELPPNWGLLEFDGKVLVERRAAPRLDAQPLDLPMIAAIFRRASEAQTAAIADFAAPYIEERVAKEKEYWENSNRIDSDTANKATERWQRAEHILHAVDQALGLNLWSNGYPRELVGDLTPEMKDKLEAFRRADLAELKQALKIAAHHLRTATVQARTALRSAGIRPARRGGHSW